MSRECDGFTNPCRSQVQVGMGAGAGLEIATLGKPAPVAQVYGFLTNEIRWVPHVTRMTTNQHQHRSTTASAS